MLAGTCRRPTAPSTGCYSSPTLTTPRCAPTPASYRIPWRGAHFPKPCSADRVPRPSVSGAAVPQSGWARHTGASQPGWASTGLPVLAPRLANDMIAPRTVLVHTHCVLCCRRYNAGSGGLFEMHEWLDTSRVLYGLVKMPFGTGQFRRIKWVWLQWVGDDVPPMTVRCRGSTGQAGRATPHTPHTRTRTHTGARAHAQAHTRTRTRTRTCTRTHVHNTHARAANAPPPCSAGRPALSCAARAAWQAGVRRDGQGHAAAALALQRAHERRQPRRDHARGRHRSRALRSRSRASPCGTVLPLLTRSASALASPKQCFALFLDVHHVPARARPAPPDTPTRAWLLVCAWLFFFADQARDRVGRRLLGFERH